MISTTGYIRPIFHRAADAEIRVPWRQRAEPATNALTAGPARAPCGRHRGTERALPAHSRGVADQFGGPMVRDTGGRSASLHRTLSADLDVLPIGGDRRFRPWGRQSWFAPHHLYQGQRVLSHGPKLPLLLILRVDAGGRRRTTAGRHSIGGDSDRQIDGSGKFGLAEWLPNHDGVRLLLPDPFGIAGDEQVGDRPLPGYFLDGGNAASPSQAGVDDHQV
jgi:hypothetical protein